MVTASCRVGSSYFFSGLAMMMIDEHECKDAKLVGSGDLLTPGKCKKKKEVF